MMRTSLRIRAALLLSLLGLVCSPVMAATPEILITIKGHQFTPSEVKVPQGVKVKLIIDNQDATPEEFESHALNREKVIAGKTKGSVFIGPLKAGKYDFVGEFHAATAKGTIVVE